MIKATMISLWIFASASTVNALAGSDGQTFLPAPKLFEAGTISSGANDGAPSFSRDGNTILFERTNSRWSIILIAHRQRGGWTKPTIAPFSGRFNEQQPSFAPDGTYVLFVSSRKTATGSVSHLYRVDRLRTGWSTPVELPPTVNISKSVFKPSIAANGDIYFMADVGSGGMPRWRLFVSHRNNDGYQAAEPLPFSSADDGDVDPFIDPRGRFIIFSSNTRSVLADGHEHLFIANMTSVGWSKVRALRYEGDDWGGDDGEAQIGPDGRTLYFTSSRVLPVAASPRSINDALAALRRMNSWDNSNNNVWSLTVDRLGEVAKR